MTELSDEQKSDLFDLRRKQEYESTQRFHFALAERRRAWLMFRLMDADRVYGYEIEARLRGKVPARKKEDARDVPSFVEDAVYILAYDGYYAGKWRDFGGERRTHELFDPLHPFVSLVKEDEKRFSLSRYELSFLGDTETITRKEVERWLQTIEFFQGPIEWRPQALVPFLFAGSFSLIPFGSVRTAQKRLTFDRDRKQGFGNEGNFLVQRPYGVRNLRIGTCEVNRWHQEIRRWGAVGFRRLLNMGRLPGEVGKRPVQKNEDPRNMLSSIEPLMVQDPGAMIVSTSLHYWKARHQTPPTSTAEGMFLFHCTFCKDERDRFSTVGKLIANKQLVLGVYQMERPYPAGYDSTIV